VASAAPGLALSALGLAHPAQLTPQTAALWWQLHVVLLPIFPLLGAPIVLLLRKTTGIPSWIARVGVYLYAVFYTGLDTLAGIGAGLAVAAEPGGSPVALDLIRVGDALSVVGVYGFLVAAVVTAVVVLRRAGPAAAPGAALLVGAAVVFLHSHIYWPVGGLAVLAIGLGCALLAWAQARPSSRDGRSSGGHVLGP